MISYNSVGCDNSITVRDDNNCQVTGGGWWEGPHVIVMILITVIMSVKYQ